MKDKKRSIIREIGAFFVCLQKALRAKIAWQTPYFRRRSVKNMASLDDLIPSPVPCVFAVPIVALLHTEFIQAL
jgi:hypothetical protein